jgi:hypothetical protein
LDRSGEDMQSHQTQSLLRDKKAVTPAISTVILTSAVVVLILVAMTFANTFLDSRLAENEFSANKQFMITTALQVDDIAWTVGRTQTVRYSSDFGNMKFQNSTLRYTFEVDDGTGFKTLFTQETGIILFNIPVTSYSLGNNYFQRVSPMSNGSFLQEGPSAPVSEVICVEKLPMADGSYIRIAVVPTIRILQATIGSSTDSTKYVKFYLPALMNGTNKYLSQSVTLTGDSITKFTKSGIRQVRISVASTVDAAAAGFDSGFFNFDQVSKTISLSNPNSVVEFYVGNVLVRLGQV